MKLSAFSISPPKTSGGGQLTKDCSFHWLMVFLWAFVKADHSLLLGADSNTSATTSPARPGREGESGRERKGRREGGREGGRDGKGIIRVVVKSLSVLAESKLCRLQSYR